MDHVMVLTNEERIAHQRASAIALDPVRFKDSKPELEKTALHTLNAYLRDITSSINPKRIATRNKRFFVQFGDACTYIFEYLGFHQAEVDEDQYWFLPQLEQYPGKTPLGSQRAFYEDARSEVQALIDETPTLSDNEMRPVSAKYRLERALYCYQLEHVSDKKAGDNEENFRILGTIPNSSDKLLQFAYLCQVQTDPANRKRYCLALQHLASPRKDDLQLFAATQASLAEAPQNMNNNMDTKNDVDMTNNDPLDHAYTHFNLRPNCSENDAFLVRQFKVYLEQAPAQRAQHRQMLFQIGKGRNSPFIKQAACEGMDFTEACEFLELGDSVKAGTAPSTDGIIGYADMQIKDGKEPWLVATALDVIAENFNNLGIKSMADEIRGIGGSSITVGTSGENDTDNGDPVDINLPLGLDNLRNTCYLNSILQYFFTVKSVKEVVSDFNPDTIPSTEQIRQNGEVYLGREFVLELQKLFSELDNASTTFVKPRQRLANAAWLSPDKAQKTEKTTAGSGAQSTAASESRCQPTPPPLPARPVPPIPSTRAGGTEPTVTVDAIPENLETLSTASSQTLINQPDGSSDYFFENASLEIYVDETNHDKDTEKETAKGAPHGAWGVAGDASSTNDSHKDTEQHDSNTMFDSLVAALDQTEVVGTDQMDVEEVMGRCINHLRAAINPASVISANDATNQKDKVTETFYITFVNSRANIGSNEWSRTTSQERWVTANPGTSGKVHLYDALDGFFDREVIGNKLISYTSIVKAPPIFHICIQRSKVGGGKNSNPVEIPETLYLDRYMDDKEGTEAFTSRKRCWDIKNQLHPLEELPSDGQNSVDVGVVERYSKSPELIESGSGDSYTIIDPRIVAIFERYGFTGSDLDDEAIDLTNAESPENLDTELDSYIDNNQNDKEETLKAELSSLFESEGMRKHKYRLHAVICHAGQTAKFGHYWVWIYDFEQNIWRKYNDKKVTENPDSKAVLEELSSRGEPYYLAYVRDQDKDELVNVPRRKPAPAPAQEVEMTDFDAPITEHVENSIQGQQDPPLHYC